MHLCVVQASVRHDNYMVGSTVRITTVEVVIERRNTVVDTADSPVVTDVQIIECTSLDSGILGGSHGATQRLTTVNCIVRPGVVKEQRSDFRFRTLNRLGSEIGKGDFLQACAIVNRNQTRIGRCGERREFRHFLGFNTDCTHFYSSLYFQSATIALPKSSARSVVPVLSIATGTVKRFFKVMCSSAAKRSSTSVI